jgi:hypothetical protein
MSIVPVLFLSILQAQSTLAMPVTQYYQYFSDGRELLRPNYTTPAKFNSIAIGTTELNHTGIVETVHTVSEGHHFFQLDCPLPDPTAS